MASTNSFPENMRPNLDFVVSDEDEEPSGIKTPPDLQDFEHLLPLFSTPSSNLALSGQPLLSPELSTALSHFPVPLSSLSFKPGPFDQPPTTTAVSEPGSTDADTISDYNLSRRLLICPTVNQPQPRRCEASKLRDEALYKYLSPAKDETRREASEPSQSTPLLDVTRPLANLRPAVRRDAFGPLRSCSRWSGHQRSGARSYSVSVRILDLDLHIGSGSGLLEITGLTDKWPKLVTFFDIEIVGPHHSFVTNAWGATAQSDYAHWSRFPHYGQARMQELARRTGNQLACQPFLFMRWKERFLDGNPSQREIEGASFAGFYYVCLDLSGGDADSPARPADPPDSYSNVGPVDVESPGRATGRIPSLPPHHSQSGTEEEMPPRWHMSTEPLPSLQAPNIEQDWSCARITAYYYHAKSEPYQELKLKPEHCLPHALLAGPSATYQFS